MKPRSIVLFSSYVPKDKLWLGKAYLDIIDTVFPKTPVLIGDSHGSCEEWWMPLANSGRLIGKSDARFNIDSDAEGFMECLRMLKRHGEEYDIVWLFHTKGSSHDDDYALKYLGMFKRIFFGRRYEIERCYEVHRKLGVVGNFLMPNRHSFANTYRLSTVYPHFKCQPIGYMAVHTFYAMNGHAIHNFIHKCHLDFFERNIVSDLGFDRWFFEANFPAVADMQGYDIFSLDAVPFENREKYLLKLESWRRDPVNYKPETFSW